MIRKFGMLAAFAGGATAAHAGGLEQTTQSAAVLFEDGRYFEVNLAFRAPEVSGVLGVPSGNIGVDSLSFGFAYKADINDQLSYALIYDQPYQASVDYPTGTGYPFQGSSADFTSHALTGLLKYQLNNNVSVYGGLRFQSIQAEATVISPALPITYTADTDPDFRLGYVVGAAYEKPEIALRVALTYHSAVEHELDTVELGTVPSVTEIEMPQALNLEFQTGVAEDTLVFGSVRWVEWSESDISPQVYSTFGVGPLVSFTDDRITYTLGAARRLNETWAVAGSVSYEKVTGSITGNLAPSDGVRTIGVAAIYNKDNMEITAGVRYAELGRADTTATAVFEDNTAVGAGLRVGWSF